MPQAHIVPLARKHRLLISSCLSLIVALAWVYLVLLDRRMSASMRSNAMMAAMGMSPAAPWTTADIVLTFVMWTVMMIGMMAASTMPVLLLFATVLTELGRPKVPRAVLAFGVGFLSVWIGFSVVATVAQWVMHDAALLTPALSASNPLLAGTIVIVAGVYQLTPLKHSCLMHCRSPLGSLMTTWHDGRTGAFRMGFDNGMYCLGCCWALMCVLFAIGVMNLMWVAALSVFVLFEKLRVGPPGVTRVTGAAMIVAGLIVAARVF
jgi:predicted metal-binding membrane protein